MPRTAPCPFYISCAALNDKDLLLPSICCGASHVFTWLKTGNFPTSLPSFLEREAELQLQESFLMDSIVSDYILSLGLTFSIALIVAFRAGQAREINSINLEEKVNDLTISALKEKRVSQLEIMFRVYKDTTPDFYFELPQVQEVAERLFFIDERIPYLNELYMDLVNQGTQSIPFSQALELGLSFVG